MAPARDHLLQDKAPKLGAGPQCLTSFWVLWAAWAQPEVPTAPRHPGRQLRGSHARLIRPMPKRATSSVAGSRPPPRRPPSPADRCGPGRLTSGEVTPAEGHTWGDRVAISTACWSSHLRLKCGDAQNRCLGDKDIGCYLNDN